MFKKTLLGSAIVAAMGISSIAQAAVDLDDSVIGVVGADGIAANGSLVYASEILVAAAGTDLDDNATDVQNLTVELGFSVNETSTRFVRIDLGNGAEFEGTPGMGVGATVGTISAGGAGESFVIFEFTAAATYGPTQAVTIDVEGITIGSIGDITATYNLFETGTAAANEGTALATVSQTAYRFAPALAVTAEAAGEGTIDVASNSTEFVVDAPVTATSSPIAQVKIGVTGNLWTDSLSAAMTDLVGATTALVVTGDFSAAGLNAQGNPDTAAVTLNGDDATTLTATTATFTVGTNDGVAVVTLEVTGDDEIIAGAYTGVYDVTASATATTADRNLGQLSNLQKNGSNATANMVLTPSDEGGAFRNFVRISNTSSIDGAVFVRLWNDLGESVAFGLGDIAGQEGVLGAQESTSLINVDDLFAAAEAADATFAIGTEGRNKLRMSVEGEFTSISLDNVTVSRDNQSFSTFQ